MYRSLYFPDDRKRAITLLFLAAIIYLPFLGNPLVFDDVPFFRNALHYADAHFDLGLRWFPYTSFGVTAVFTEGIEAHRLGNLLLHAMNALLLLLVLRMWIILLAPEEGRGTMASWGAWLGALVFACHPLAVYGTGYLVQRSILMATMFVLLMHLAYFRGLLQGERRYLALAVLCYFLAVFSKEHSLLAPAILLPMTWVLRQRSAASARVTWFAWLGFALVGLLVVARIKGIIGQTYEKDAVVLLGGESAHISHLLSALTQAGLFFKYLFLVLVPNPAWMSLDMREAFLNSASDWQSWCGLTAYVVAGGGGIFLLLRGGILSLAGVAILYPWSLYFVEFTSIRVQEIFVLYRAYLWMPGVMLVFPLLLRRRSGRTIAITAIVIALVLLPLAINRMWVFADKYRVWDDAVKLLSGENRLGAHRIYYNRGMASMEAKEWERAAVDFQKALTITSHYPEINTMLGNAYASMQRYPEAISEYDKAILGLPKEPHAYFGKGMALKRLKNEREAMQYMKKSCELGMDAACVIASADSHQQRGILSHPASKSQAGGN